MHAQAVLHTPHRFGYGDEAPASALPRWWRVRAVLRVATRAIRDGYEPCRTTVRVRRGQARVEIRASLFCRVREAQAVPQCDFHAALIGGLLSAFNLPASVHIDSCAGAGAAACLVVVDLAAGAKEATA